MGADNRVSKVSILNSDLTKYVMYDFSNNEHVQGGTKTLICKNKTKKNLTLIDFF